MSKKIYLIYAEKDIIDKLFVSIGMPVNNILDDTNYTLYAITDKKKYKNQFIKERINDFKVKSFDIDDIDNYDEFKEKHKKYYLNYFNYLNNFTNESLSILSTQYEFDEVHIYWFDQIVDVSKISFINNDNYKIFSNKVQKLFSKMKLDNLFSVFGDYDYPSDDYEFNYPSSDDISNVIHLYRNIYDNTSNIDLIYEAEFAGNEDNIFIKIFGNMFK